MEKPVTNSSITVTTDYDFKPEKLLAALKAGDDIGAVIRCHFEAEQAVNDMLNKLTFGRYKEGNNKRSYKYLSDKLKFLKLVGIPENLLLPLELLNNHRNKFAHDGQTEIELQQFEELRNAVHQNTKSRLNDELIFRDKTQGYEKTFAEASLREKYVCAAYYGMLALSSFRDLQRQLAEK